VRVLLLNSYFDEPRGGGTEVVLSILSHGLARRGHQVCVVSTRSDSGCVRGDAQGVKTVKLGIRNLYWPLDPTPQPAWKRLLWHAIDRYNPAAAADVAAVARDFKPDIVSVHNLMGFSAAAWVALAQLGRPLVHMLHDYQLICSKTTMFKDGAICEH
jgi:glycosyltransferase involved in cell wall biosynthesis